MQRTIKLNNRDIDYTRRVVKRSKSIKLSVNHDGQVVVSSSRYVPQFIINKFLKDKSDWIIEKIDNAIKVNGGALKSKAEKQDEYLKYKYVALKSVEERLEYFNKFYDFKWGRITIRNQKTRWGSCSKKGNLNFNYKIALLSPKSSDYIIVHELCHLGEFNHGKKFWDLVAIAVPDYKEIRRSLHTNGLRLG